MSAAMFGVLMEQLDAVRSRETARAVVLTGNGRGFCAGADLSAGGKLVENRDSIEEAMNRGVTASSPSSPSLVPVIAAVNGALPASGSASRWRPTSSSARARPDSRPPSAASVRSSTAALRGRSHARSARLARSRWPPSPVTQSTRRPRSNGGWYEGIRRRRAARGEAIALARRLAEGPTEAYALIKGSSERPDRNSR